MPATQHDGLGMLALETVSSRARDLGTHLRIQRFNPQVRLRLRSCPIEEGPVDDNKLHKSRFQASLIGTFTAMLWG